MTDTQIPVAVKAKPDCRPNPDVRREAQLSMATERARHDELRDLLADLPDPEEYAFLMPAWMSKDLLTAHRRKCSLFVHPSVAKRLRPHGLVDYCTNCLTAFGHSVWKILMEDEA